MLAGKLRSISEMIQTNQGLIDSVSSYEGIDSVSFYEGIDSVSFYQGIDSVSFYQGFHYQSTGTLSFSLCYTRSKLFTHDFI